MEILAPDGVGVSQNLKPKQLQSLNIFLFGKEFNKWWGQMEYKDLFYYYEAPGSVRDTVKELRETSNGEEIFAIVLRFRKVIFKIFRFLDVFRKTHLREYSKSA